LELTAPLSSIRTQLCVVVAGCATDTDREEAWPHAAEEFLRGAHRLGLQITIIGPRPPRKFGSKKTVRFLDRHEVIGLKTLTASRSYPLEFRVLSTKTKAWTRLRAETCVTIGNRGVWPQIYDGWTLPGTVTLDAFTRWMGEYRRLPGRDIVFIGSQNRSVRWACEALDRGARSCVVVEPGETAQAWRAHRDRLAAKGGRVLPRHRVVKVEREDNRALSVYLANEQGTLIVPADTIVLSPMNDDALNLPAQWSQGLYYVQRRTPIGDVSKDEEEWLERVDWRETYWRVAKRLGAVDHAEAEGALKKLRAERRKLLAYRKAEKPAEFGYSGKILDRDTLSRVLSSPSVPRTFARQKPVASLECLEPVPCRACADACPESAIEVAELTSLPKLLADKCTGCGACVAACPAGAAVMARELPDNQKTRYFLPDDTKEIWKQGRSVELINRRGDRLGSGRVISSASYEGGRHRILEIESTNVYAWDARGFRAPTAALDDGTQKPSTMKRGWITLNGVKRLSPIDVPVTVALWELGSRRFEDAQFCRDGGCRLCEVVVDGHPTLACRTSVREGQDIAFTAREPSGAKPLCPCKGVTKEEFQQLLDEGVPQSLARELTGLGRGVCHGRWCLSSSEMPGASEPGGKPRPVFHGYETSPWRDVWVADVVIGGDSDEPERDE
jgi:ferredoxin